MKARHAIYLLMLLIAAAPPRRTAPPNADAAGNRIVAFAPVTPPRLADDPDPFALHCTADRTADRRWCARLREDEGGSNWWLELSQGSAPARRFDVAGVHDEESAFAIWPQIVIEAGGAVMVGVEARRTTGYSGGGASATGLVLVRAEPGGGALRQVLDVPLRAMKEIRACFGPRDMRRRRNACSDLYEFAGTLTLDPATRAGRPHFLFSARARTWPGRRTLGSDSTTAPPLRRSDIRWAVDPVCTYRRRLAFDSGEGRYLPDRPLPDCADYLDI
jgi:hypothetical protein